MGVSGPGPAPSRALVSSMLWTRLAGVAAIPNNALNTDTLTHGKSWKPLTFFHDLASKLFKNNYKRLPTSQRSGIYGLVFKYFEILG